MRSRKCRTGPSDCGKRPPSSSIYVSTSEVQSTTEGITTLSPAGLVAWGSAGCRPHRKTPRSRKFNSTENMKTTSETDPDWVSNGKQTARKCFQTLQGSFSAVSKPNCASKYSLELGLESSRRDRHNALLSNLNDFVKNI